MRDRGEHPEGVRKFHGLGVKDPLLEGLDVIPGRMRDTCLSQDRLSARLMGNGGGAVIKESLGSRLLLSAHSVCDGCPHVGAETPCRK